MIEPTTTPLQMEFWTMLLSLMAAKKLFINFLSSEIDANWFWISHKLSWPRQCHTILRRLRFYRERLLILSFHPIVIKSIEFYYRFIKYKLSFDFNVIFGFEIMFCYRLSSPKCETANIVKLDNTKLTAMMDEYGVKCKFGENSIFNSGTWKYQPMRE